MTTITKQVTTINGDVMKELKNMIKGHKKRTVPALETIKIEPSEREYYIKAIYTDGDFYAVRTFESIECTLDKPFLLPVSYIKSIKGIKKTDIFTFEPGEVNTINVTSKGMTQNVYTINYEEFPVFNINREEFKSIGNLMQDDLNSLKAATLSTSKTDTRPVLQYALIRDNSIISTDSHRLFKTNTNLSHDTDILFNKNFITYLVANEKKDFSSTIAESENYLKIETHNATYYQRKFDGNFPEVSRLIPNEFNLQFEILEYDKFIDTMDSVKSLGITNNVVKMVTTKDSIILSSEIPGTGKIESEIKVNYTKYNDFKITYSASYMLDGIKQINSRNIQLNLISNIRPFVVSELKDLETMALILPVRTY